MTRKAGVMTPKGFLFSTAEAAIKKPGRKDIALILSEAESAIAGTFTTNSVKAAPVKICMRKIRSGRGQAIIINSGNANACTGKQGEKDAQEIIATISKKLNIRPSLIYPSSTGVIGMPLPMEKIIPSLDQLTLSSGESAFSDIARAIMTTDTFPKTASRRVKVGSHSGTISGICKGAGMIAPNMATMLCFILTDIAVEQRTMNSILKDAVKRSFNRITIDGDMSTNDTVLMMANGMLGNAPVNRRSPSVDAFSKAVLEVTGELAGLVVKDGEGATKIIAVTVRGAKTESDAERAAFAIADSNLVKTAVYGNDANWGRIICALGYSGTKFREEKTDIFFGKIKVVKGGVTNNRDREATEALRSKEVKIIVDLHAGTASAQVLTCDFTEEYVRINAEYRT